jgi:hypothetical protein
VSASGLWFPSHDFPSLPGLNDGFRKGMLGHVTSEELFKDPAEKEDSEPFRRAFVEEYGDFHSPREGQRSGSWHSLDHRAAPGGINAFDLFVEDFIGIIEIKPEQLL